MQGAFEGAALLGEVAAPVRGDPPGEGAVDLGQALLGDDRDQLGAAPRADEGHRADRLHGEVGEETGGLGGGGTADRRAVLPVVLGQRRLPQGEDQFAPGRGVVVHRADRQPGQPSGRHRGFGGGGRGEQEDGVGAVAGAEAAQAADHLGDVRAEDPPVGVALVDDDVAQGAQEGGPARVGREDAAVQHVGVGEDEVGVLADPFALLDRGVAVVDGGPDGVAERGREFLDGAQLVGGEGLGGREVERGGAAPVGGLGAVEEARRGPGPDRRGTCRRRCRWRRSPTARPARARRRPPGAPRGPGCPPSGPPRSPPGESGRARRHDVRLAGAGAPYE